jgi:hypothetical protein
MLFVELLKLNKAMEWISWVRFFSGRWDVHYH